MALAEDVEALTKAFSGQGIDEKSLISILGKWGWNERDGFRKETPNFFMKDERQFERWDDRCIRLLKHEFMRFKNAVVLRAMHPWERDARLAKEALQKGEQAYGVLVEIACTRSSQELLGARKAYHSLFDCSLEEDIASHIHGPQRKLLIALGSAYRYEGPKVKDEIAKSEAQELAIAMKNEKSKPIIEDDGVIRILATRSKPHIQAIYNHYKKISGKYLDQDLEDLRLKETVQCLCVPQTYFSKVLDAALKIEGDKNIKKALTRIIITRADTDIKQINEEYQNLYGVSLSQKIEEITKGNYRDFLLTLIARGN